MVATQPAVTNLYITVYSADPHALYKFDHGLKTYLCRPGDLATPAYAAV